MPIQTPYLFTAAMDVEPAREALFNEIYDGEHVPLILKVPGVIAAARFKRQELTMVIGGERKTIVVEHEPLYNALYEIESPEVLTSDAWAKAVDQGRWPGQARPGARARVPRRPLVRRSPGVDPRDGPARARRHDPPALLSSPPARPGRPAPHRALRQSEDAGALRPRLGGPFRLARRARVGATAHPRADGAGRGGRRRPRSPAWPAPSRGRDRGANRYRVPRVLWEGRASSAGVRSKARALDLTTRSTAQAVARWTYPYRVLLRMPPIATYSALIAAILSRVISPCAERTSSLYRRAELPPKIALLTIPSAGPSGAKPCFFCMSSGISRRRSASICHCGDPYHTESLPQTTWSAPRPRTRVPMNAAAKRGFATAELAKAVPISP